MRALSPHLAIAGAFALVVIGAPAQQSITPGEPVRCTLGAGTTAEFTIPASAHHGLRATVQSQAFTPRVTLRGPGTSDSDTGASARVQISCGTPGTATLTVSAQDSGGAGEFTVQIEAVQPRASRTASTIIIGQRVQGRLSDRDRCNVSGEYHDSYVFQGRAGQRVTVTLRSTSFDAFLIVRTPRGVQHEDDDSGGGSDARLSLTLPEAGTYRIDATSVQARDRGDYTLHVE